MGTKEVEVLVKNRSLVVCLSLLCMILCVSQVLLHSSLFLGLSVPWVHCCGEDLCQWFMSWSICWWPITEITLSLRLEKHFRSSKSVSVVCTFVGHRDQLLCRMEYFNWSIFYCRSRYADMLHDKDRVSTEAKPFWMVGKEPLHFSWMASLCDYMCFSERLNDHIFVLSKVPDLLLDQQMPSYIWL